MSYRVEGRFFEACDCFVPCPCWFGESADEGECTGIVGWQIENGEISGIDVTGLAIVSISQHTGGRDAPIHGRVALLIDATASDEQERAVTAAFTGQLGGPLGELARMGGTPSTMQSVSACRSDCRAQVAVGR